MYLSNDKFFMVTGGYFDSGDLDSTEIFSDNVWKTVAGKLFIPMYGLKAVTISNRVLIFGNNFIICNVHVYKEAFFRRICI